MGVINYRFLCLVLFQPRKTRHDFGLILYSCAKLLAIVISRMQASYKKNFYAKLTNCVIGRALH